VHGLREECEEMRELKGKWRGRAHWLTTSLAGRPWVSRAGRGGDAHCHVRRVARPGVADHSEEEEEKGFWCMVLVARMFIEDSGEGVQRRRR